MVDMFFSPKMLPKANESLAFSNIAVGKKKVTAKEKAYLQFREHSTFGNEPQGSEYQKFDKALLDRMGSVYKKVN